MPSTVIPGFRYQDAPRAVDWLCQAFGFEKGLVVESNPNFIDHAQLHHGQGMVMVGSVVDDQFGRLITTVDQVGGATASVYVVVEDVEAHVRQARDAGAEIIMEPEEQDYGGSSYTCRDFEGNIWSFGSYNPWTDKE